MNKINNLKEAIQNDDFISNFYLVTCERKKDGTLECTEVINLPKDNYPLTIDLNGSICFITDKEGNIIEELTKRTKQENKFRIEKYIVDYIDENKMIISSIKNTNEDVYQTEYINYVENNIQKRILFDHRKGGTLQSIRIPNPNIKTAIIQKLDKDGMQDTRLFSIERGKFISPALSSITKVKDDKEIMRYDDLVYSNKIVDGKRQTTTLSGLITLNGIMSNKVYDSNINQIRQISTNDGHLMEAYRNFRERVKEELDYKFEEEMQNKRRKEKCLEKSLMQLKGRKKGN